ncbi:nitroreductase family protein [Candidatus Solincola tengchongensis]|uniref:nitroreductase family protein n=1 Tax=Candidatus Solincola tengchongensis TaxID=2900693 RepID=UPI00257D84AC|nr:nitroreductase family protein [Candidatus Solincola tengchongensis]
MDVFEAMEKRHSVRSFDAARGVPDELVARLLRCACLAPTAGNVQPWRFVVVRDGRIKEGLAAAALGQGFVARAPVVIVVCADLESHAASYGRRGVELYSIQDTAAAVENMLLAATALGLGACWVGAFREEEVASLLGLPERLRPLALIPVGYPARPGSQPRKMPPERLTTYL